jgi:hypothetical protein
MIPREHLGRHGCNAITSPSACGFLAQKPPTMDARNLSKGPVIFRALPKGPAQGGNNTAKNILVIYDFAKCRGGPGDPSAPEVFYEFKIRNESTVDVPFMLEIILFSDLPINHG